MKLFIPATISTLATSQAIGAGSDYDLTVSGIFTAATSAPMRSSTNAGMWQIEAGGGSWRIPMFTPDGTNQYPMTIVVGGATKMRLFSTAALTWEITGIYWS